MTDRPVIFSSPMIRALLENRKTMTRRLAWHPTKKNIFGAPWPTPWQKVRPGDRLWVREAWRIEGCGSGVSAEACRIYRGPGREIEYRADEYKPVPWMERSPIHMPRWASRITLVVTETKIERVQAISVEDAIAEGCDGRKTVRQFALFGSKGEKRKQIIRLHAPGDFADLWCSLHGPAAWDDNPEVVALRFEVHKVNIDRMQEAA
jgi:hypothetical protein